MDLDTLIAKSRGGDRDAFGAVVVRFRQMVFRLAFRLLCDEEEAKDAVQDTFVKAWVSLKRYDPEYSFATWLYRIAANICYDTMRSSKRRKTEHDIPQEHRDDTANAEGRLLNDELRHNIIALTERLSPKQKLIFTLSDLEELSADEIRDITGLSLSSIKSNLYMARKHIRESMKL